MNSSAYNPAYTDNQKPTAPSLVLHESDSDDEHEGEEHKHCAEARAELTRYGFPPSHKAQIAIALDVSVSMHDPNNFYDTGKIQKLIEIAMDMAIELSPNAKHTVTIFPFGAVAFAPVVIDEHDIKNAVSNVWQSIGRVFSEGTNYNVVTQAIRQHYFKINGKLTSALPSDTAPVFCLFVTDGEPREERDEARNQFRWSEYNAIFFKFIALKGKQKDLQFQTLDIICKLTKATYVPNKHLIILDDPKELTIKKLFENYRLWAIEAFKHKILVNNPGINYNVNKPNDLSEKKLSDSLNAVHGHDDDESYDHASPSNSNSNKKFLLILGLLGAVFTPLVITTTLPLWFMVGIGFGFGVAAGATYNSIYDCIFPIATNYPGFGSNSNNHGNDSDDDDHHDSSHNPQHLLWNQLQSNSHSASSVSTTASVQLQPYQQYQPLQYQPIPSANNGIPSWDPPPYSQGPK
ncbi:MAG: VWA domain-containing protein [Pseudomonadota bacterium]